MFQNLVFNSGFNKAFHMWIIKKKNRLCEKKTKKSPFRISLIKNSGYASDQNKIKFWNIGNKSATVNYIFLSLPSYAKGDTTWYTIDVTGTWKKWRQVLAHIKQIEKSRKTRALWKVYCKIVKLFKFTSINYTNALAVLLADW